MGMSRCLMFVQRRSVSRMVSLPFDEFGANRGALEATTPKAVVFLHGFLGNRRNNRSAGRELAARVGTDVFIPDLRNHGKAFHAPTMNYGAMVQDIADFIHKLHTTHKVRGKVYLMGHSMGGKLAMMFSLLHPELVAGVISIDNVPYRNPAESLGEFQKFHMALREMELSVERNPNWTIAKLRAHLLRWVEPNRHIVDFYLTNMAHSEGTLRGQTPLHVLRDSIEDVLEWRLEEFGDMEEYAQYSPQVQHTQRTGGPTGKPTGGPTGPPLRRAVVETSVRVPPLLLIRATRSTFAGTLDAAEIARWFPHWESVDVDSSHWVVTERRDEFVDIVDTWIRKEEEKDKCSL